MGIKQKILHRNAGFGVEHTGFEPVTSTMRTAVLILQKRGSTVSKEIPSIYVHARNMSC